MLGKRLFAFFNHWKTNSTVFNSSLNSRVKDTIYRLYRAKCRIHFAHWRKNATKKHITKKKMMVQEMMQDQTQLENENIDKSNDLKKKVEAVSNTKAKVNNKIFKKYMLRVV